MRSAEQAGGGDKDAGHDGAGDNAGDIGAHGHGKDDGEGIFILSSVLGKLCGGGHAGHAGDADDGVEVLALSLVEPVHDPAAGQTADGGNGKSQNAKDQNDQNGGVQDGGGLTE